MLATPLEQRIRDLVGPSLEAMGFAPVLVRLRDGGKRRVLEVVAERRDGTGMTLDDCTEISHTVSALLDVEDPITGAYQLEVSSPGLDRPLVSPEDFERFRGQEAKVETQLPVEGRKRFRGVLEGLRDSDVLLRCDGELRILPFAGLRSARLVLTDERMTAALRQGKKGGKKKMEA